MTESLYMSHCQTVPYSVIPNSHLRHMYYFKFSVWLHAKWLKKCFITAMWNSLIKFLRTLPVLQLHVALRRLESRTSVSLHPNVSEICCIFVVPPVGILAGEWRHVHTTIACTCHWKKPTNNYSGDCRGITFDTCSLIFTRPKVTVFPMSIPHTTVPHPRWRPSDLYGHLINMHEPVI